MYNKIIKDRDKSFWIKFPRYNALYSDEKLEVMLEYTYPNGTKADVKYSDREKIAIAIGLYLMCSCSKTNFIYDPTLAILEASALLKNSQTPDSDFIITQSFTTFITISIFDNIPVSKKLN